MPPRALVGGVSYGTRTYARQVTAVIPMRAAPAPDLPSECPPMPLTRWQQTWRNMVAIGVRRDRCGSRWPGRSGDSPALASPSSTCLSASSRSCSCSSGGAGLGGSPCSPRWRQPSRRRRRGRRSSPTSRCRPGAAGPRSSRSVSSRSSAVRSTSSIQPTQPDTWYVNLSSASPSPASSPRSACTSVPAASCSPTCRTAPSAPSASRSSRSPRAQANERTRIAREMHDVLAHRMSLVAMHAGALAYRDDLTPEETRDAAEIIQANSHRALTDLREILGVLRDHERWHRRHRPPSAAHPRRPRRPARGRASRGCPSDARRTSWTTGRRYPSRSPAARTGSCRRA